MPVRSDGIRDRRKLYRNPPSHLGNQGKPPSTWRTSFLRPLPRRGRAFVLLRSHHAPFFGGNPFTPKLRGCTAVPLPARATCGRDKRRHGRGRLRRWRACSGERRPPMEVSGADSHPSRSERRGPRDGCERAPRGQPHRSLRRSGAQRPSGLPGRTVAS